MRRKLRKVYERRMVQRERAYWKHYYLVARLEWARVLQGLYDEYKVTIPPGVSVFDDGMEDYLGMIDMLPSSSFKKEFEGAFL